MTPIRLVLMGVFLIGNCVNAVAECQIADAKLEEAILNKPQR